MATQDSTSERTYCVYRIVCFPTGKVYVGMTWNPKHRQHEHFSKLKTGTHGNPRLQRAYNKYGKAAFYFEILEQGLSIKQVGGREQHWIEVYDARKKGFNCKDGGETGGRPGVGCTWNGVFFETLTAAAEANNMSLQALKYRLDQGYTCDNDLSEPSSNLRKPCTWNGQHFASIKDAALSLSVPFKTMSEWLAKGWLSDLDVRIRGNPQGCIWNSIPYLSLTAAAKANGVSRTQMRRRLEQGWTCDNDVPVAAKDKKIPCEWNEVIYDSILSAARALNITNRAMHQRIRRGYTCDSDMQKRRK